jgi:hypothetical protein
LKAGILLPAFARIFFLWIQRAVQRQIEFASHAGVGRVGEGIFAVGGVLELTAGILKTSDCRRSADIILASGAKLRRRSLRPTKLN